MIIHSLYSPPSRVILMLGDKPDTTYLILITHVNNWVLHLFSLKFRKKKVSKKKSVFSYYIICKFYIHLIISSQF